MSMNLKTTLVAVSLSVLAIAGASAPAFAGNSHKLTQFGDGNLSHDIQKGDGNHLVKAQWGGGTSSTAQQTGNGNTLAVMQFGKGAKSDVQQTGNGKMNVQIDLGFE